MNEGMPVGPGSDLCYHPVVRDASGWVERDRPTALLVCGGEVPSNAPLAGQARYLVEPDAPLPAGIYRFRTAEGEALFVIDSPVPPGSPDSADWAVPDDHPLIAAYGWFDALWPLGTEVPTPAFDEGAHATTVPEGQEAVIRRRTFDRGQWWYRARVEGRTVSLPESSLAAPMVDDDPFEWIERPPADVDRFSATLTRAKLREELTDTVYSFRATRTILRPYQFRPVMRLLEIGSLRLLIADEVGLGKTIEAGLVWTELDARRQANRVLVVCPSMLVSKWRQEMVNRFSFETEELDRRGLDELLERVATDRFPARYRAVCSIERLRMWGGLEDFNELGPRFDLIIADEAHAFRNSGTRSHALGALLSDWADALVFLSATPLNLGNDDLYNLLELLAPGEFDNRSVLEERLAPNALLNRVSASFFDRDITNAQRRAWMREIEGLTFGPAVTAQPVYRDVCQLLDADELSARDVAEAKRLLAQLHALSAVVTRTRKVDIQEQKAVREARAIEVVLTDAEAEFYLAFSKWQFERALRKGIPPGFATQMPLRMASSCIPAAQAAVLEWEPNLIPDDLDPEDDDEPILDPYEDQPPPEVVVAAEAVGTTDTKFDRFIEALLPIVDQGHQVLVFTFSRRALAYLERRLSEHVRLCVLHGGVHRDDRPAVMARFRAGEYQVMLASRVASEGLDFEFCSTVVNWDLPWNPMEVEQRIGRVDRFGQTAEKVLVLNFHTPGTVETDIIERVHSRIGVFQDSIGELEPILQSRLSELRQTMFDFSLTEEQRQRRLDETLAAIEEQKLTRADLETARSYLSSTDDADIDGFERDVVGSGRYVGQDELVLLLRDWASNSMGARVEVHNDGKSVSVLGTPAMAQHLDGVSAAGERSLSELHTLSRRLRDAQPVHLCLDQELARTSGQDLLSANHPLVRAALRVPGHAQERFASVHVVSDEAPAGTYLVVLSIARWTGAQPSTALWTGAVDIESGHEADPAVGRAVLASLAGGALAPGLHPPSERELDTPLDAAERQLRRRQLEEEQRRVEANEALVEARRISLRETHARKIEQINRRLATVRRDNKTRAIPLLESQLATQDRLLHEAEVALEARRQGAMTVEHLAVCVAEVREGATDVG